MDNVEFLISPHHYRTLVPVAPLDASVILHFLVGDAERVGVKEKVKSAHQEVSRKDSIVGIS
jgi:hypothetical protein